MQFIQSVQLSKFKMCCGLALISLTFAGCGESKVAVQPVKGQVTLDGQPFGPVNLILTPKEGVTKGKQAAGAADATGNVTFSSYSNGDGLPFGEFQVIVVPPPGGSGNIPQIYMSETNSPLTAKVDAQTTTLKIDLLTSAGAPAIMGGGIPGAMDPAAMLKSSIPPQGK